MKNPITSARRLKMAFFGVENNSRNRLERPLEKDTTTSDNLETLHNYPQLPPEPAEVDELLEDIQLADQIEAEEEYPLDYSVYGENVIDFRAALAKKKLEQSGFEIHGNDKPRLIIRFNRD